MRKLLSLILAFGMLLGLSSVAFAADMGVQVIGGPAQENEPVNLDDLKLNMEAEIDGWGIITLSNFDFVDAVIGYQSEDYFSGKEADYALLSIDIVNTTLKPKNYLADNSVRVVFDDIYEYSGWAYQLNYDKSTEKVITQDDQFSIDPMYTGHFYFGCTLPNAVVTSKKTLQMIITIDGNEITYNIRK